MNENTPHEPAFPCDNPHHDHYMNPQKTCPGMSLRDYFAAKVLGGISSLHIEVIGSIGGAAKLCYEIADAMMEARKQ